MAGVIEQARAELTSHMLNEIVTGMGSIAFRAVYLVPPLAFASHPALAKSALLTAQIALPAVPETRFGAGRSYPYIILSVPLVRRPGGVKWLSEAIDDEVQQRIAERPDDGSGEAPSLDLAGTSRLTDFAIDEDDDGANDHRTLSDAVIAAHAERIAVLKQRMDTLRANHAPARMLDDLTIRLHRAEAARRLVVARAAVTALASGTCRDEGAACSAGADDVAFSRVAAPPASAEGRKAQHLPQKQAVLARTASTPRLSSPERGTVASVKRSGVSESRFRPFTLAYQRLYQQKTRLTLDSGFGDAPRLRRSGLRTTDAVRGRNVVPGDIAGQSVAHRLAQARRSLTHARRLLEASVTEAPHMPNIPAIQTAGLWRWPGSDKWSLASSPAGVS